MTEAFCGADKESEGGPGSRVGRGARAQGLPQRAAPQEGDPERPPAGQEGGGGMALWPLRVYSHKKRVGQRLNLTPALDHGLRAKTDAPLGPGPWRAPRCLEDNVQGGGLPKIAEKEEQSRPGAGGRSAGPSTQLQATGEDNPKENSMREETPNEMIMPLSESVTDDFQVNSSSSSCDLVSGQSLLHDDTPSSVLSCVVTDTEYRSNTEESISSLSSPEQFRRSDSLEWECPKSKEHMQYKNSTLLDISKAVAIENVTQFSNFSAILGTSSENSQKGHRKILMTLADQNISPNSKYTSKPGSDNAACEVLLAEKSCLSTLEKTKQKKTNPVIPDEKNRCLLTSTPSSTKADFVVDLSSVQKATFEELFPNVSNYVNSNEITPVSGSQENSNEFPLDASEICCIIKASPGTRQVKSKGVIVKKKKYSPPKDVPQDIIMETNGRI
ncbi:meiosis-specific kinetochore protein [Perognathus longimembris pacificus]|uniref:meiosis-specific kinetochore protein n=1 Tax=Perognathus longimembris pacificus TaxID=214514 RepID=UPI002018AD10|nr:meiosis-specific kinetochore protein [Perognathus longimembris pacificus]